MTRSLRPRVEVDKGDLEYFNGYFDAYRLVRAIKDGIEKSTDHSWVDKAIEKLGYFSDGMKTVLQEKYGKHLKYSNKSERWFIEVLDEETFKTSEQNKVDVP